MRSNRRVACVLLLSSIASAAIAATDPDDPRLAGHFSGHVTGPDGKPLPGARIFVTPAESLVPGSGPIRAETDAEGRFEFDAPDMTFTELDSLPGRREGLLIATAEGHAPDWVVTWGQ
ncbi:MAG TPA: carboxypeptidase-like regulatory domain-containing protein, partial [Planctomycetaceae bacterium]